MKRTSYALLMAALGVVVPEDVDSSVLMPRDPPGWLPTEPLPDEESGPCEVDLGEAPEDVISGSIVHDLWHGRVGVDAIAPVSMTGRSPWASLSPAPWSR